MWVDDYFAGHGRFQANGDYRPPLDGWRALTPFPPHPKNLLMTNTTTYGTVTGGVGHLKLHAAVPPPCPFRASTLSQFSSFASLNRAFQQATGWELDYTELTGSYRQRVRLNDPGFPALGKLSITDLSSILPPGLPAVSRIYCEKLLDEFNQVLAELAVCCLLYTSPSPRDRTRSRMPSSA